MSTSICWLLVNLRLSIRYKYILFIFAERICLDQDGSRLFGGWCIVFVFSFGGWCLPCLCLSKHTLLSPGDVTSLVKPRLIHNNMMTYPFYGICFWRWTFSMYEPVPMAVPLPLTTASSLMFGSTLPYKISQYWISFSLCSELQPSILTSLVSELLLKWTFVVLSICNRHF